MSSEHGPRVCVAAMIRDGRGKILLVKHRVRGWELPGGRVENGESWRDAMLREVLEETGLFGRFDDGDPRVLEGMPVKGAQYASLILLGRGIACGTPTCTDPDGCIVDARWFSRESVPSDLSDLTSTKAIRAWVDGDECLRGERDAARDIAATGIATVDLAPPPGSSDGVRIVAMTTGPLTGYAFIKIPNGGMLGPDTHDLDEHGWILNDTGALVRFPDAYEYHFGDRYTIARNREHAILARDGEVRILATFR